MDVVCRCIHLNARSNIGQFLARLRVTSSDAAAADVPLLDNEKALISGAVLFYQQRHLLFLRSPQLTSRD